jgi:hypothetical protein
MRDKILNRNQTKTHTNRSPQSSTYQTNTPKNLTAPMTNPLLNKMFKKN